MTKNGVSDAQSGIKLGYQLKEPQVTVKVVTDAAKNMADKIARQKNEVSRSNLARL